MWKKIISAGVVAIFLGVLVICVQYSSNVTDATTSENSSGHKSINTSEKKEKEIDYSFIDYTCVSQEDKTFNVVEDVLKNPTDYVNKVFKIKGTFVQTTDEITGLTYCGCMLTKPNTQDNYIIEFTPLESEIDNLPPLNTEVTIIGRFDVYNIKTRLYYNVNDAIIVEE